MTRAERRRKTGSPRQPVIPTEHLMTGGDRGRMRRAAWGVVLRVGVVVAVLCLIYAFSPLGERVQVSVAAELGVALLALIVVTAWEFRNVTRSAYPEFRALEAAAITLVLLLLSFAAIYYVMSAQSADSFNAHHLTRLNALYFTMETFSTVGFGDIVARSEAARAVVTVQMFVDLLLIALIGRALFGTARRRRERLSEEPNRPSPAGDD